MMADVRTPEPTRIVLRLSMADRARLSAAASAAGMSEEAFARDAVTAAAQEGEAVDLAAQVLENYGQGFGLDASGNSRKIAAMRARSSATP
jgi:hypothetical protein